MKQFDRELELGFETTATEAIKAIPRDKIITHQDIIYQTWLEEGVVGDYKFRTRIRRTEIMRPDMYDSWAGKCEYTTKYSKSDETAVEQDNMELNAEITPEEYKRLQKIYQLAGKEEIKKIRTYFRTPLDAFTVYTLDIYPNEEGDRARIEIEFSNKEDMKRYRVPQWLKELIE